MKLKLDENLGSVRVVGLLRLAGHDVATVHEQSLTSTADVQLIDICRCEGRCLVTLDRGFGNRIRFNPFDYPGIVVIRLPSQPTPQDLREAVETLIRGLDEVEVEGKLWIIQQRRILEYQEPADEN